MMGGFAGNYRRYRRYYIHRRMMGGFAGNYRRYRRYYIHRRMMGGFAGNYRRYRKYYIHRRMMGGFDNCIEQIRAKRTELRKEFRVVVLCSLDALLTFTQHFNSKMKLCQHKVFEDWTKPALPD
jgi:hypothetical protein